MGWKWNDITHGVDGLVKAKKQELSDKLVALAADAEAEANGTNDPVKAAHARGRAHAYLDVRDAVKP